MLAGEERSLKSWSICECAIALATGSPAFGLLDVAGPYATLIISNEDAPDVYLDRITRLLAGRGITTPPAGLRFILGRAFTLDDPMWRDRLLREVVAEEIRAVFFDPLRSVTSACDQGPREWRPAGDFLRRLATETGAAVVIGHYVVKPPVNGTDSRRRTARISGGGITASVDAPIVVERVNDTTTLLVPDSYKHASTPGPLRVQLITEGAAVRLVAEATSETAGSTLALHERIVEFLRAAGQTNGTRLAQGLHANKNAVIAALVALADEGKVDMALGPRGAKLWFLR